MNRNRVTKRINIGSMMFSPYIRIMPMHAFIVLAPFSPTASPWCSLISDAADEAMHAVEHYSDTTIGEARCVKLRVCVARISDAQPVPTLWVGRM